MWKYPSILFIAVTGFLPGVFAYADASVAVQPAILDYHAKAKDIIEGNITLKNGSDRQLDFYPVVDNVAASNGAESFITPSVADLSSSLANWIQITRGMIELAPGASQQIPLEIRVNLSAKPGEYHALIAFPDGSSRADAESRLAGAPNVEVNLEVQADVKEDLQLKSFTPSRGVFWGLPASLSYEIQNFGNQPEIPAGDVTIYDRRGREITTLTANEQGAAIDPNGSHAFSNIWNGSAGLGQYKAVLNLRYGANGDTLDDTVFFWVVPWKELIMILIIFFFCAIFGALALHSWYVKTYITHHDSRVPRFHASHVVDLRHPDIKNK